MKTIRPAFTLGILALTLSAPSARAVVVDEFQCEISAKRVGFSRGELFQVAVEASAIRRSLSSTLPDSQSYFTLGQIKLAGRSRKLLANAGLELVYRHAFKLNEQNEIVEAKQTSCMRTSAAYISTATASLCSETEDPFAADASGWDKVEIIDGVPAFKVGDFSSVMTVQENAKKVALFSFHCDYKGTSH